tara:strand:- start:312 stop:875 length:564 start_codon:yes stop_codon:yes gene_type:complete
MALTKVRGAGAEGLTLSSTSLTVANGLTLTDGDVTFADGHGLNFASTGDGSGTDSSELFHDYEEGAWGPTLPNGGSASSNRSIYTKIGDMVTAYTYVTLTSIPNDSSTFRIGGLPYTCANSSNYYAEGTIGYTGDFNANAFYGPLVANNQTYLYFHYNNGTSATVKNSGVQGATRYFILTVTYKTDS